LSAAASRQGAAPGEGIHLRLQRLPGPLQVLALGRLAATRSELGVFTTREVRDLQSNLRLPPIANPSATLSRLGRQGLVMRPSKDAWALTPLGEDELTKKASRVSNHALAVDLAQAGGAEFGERRHNTIPPFLGPLGAEDGLARVLDESAFERNVMLITRFPRSPEDHFTQLIPKLRDAVTGHDLVLQVASDGMAEDTLWANVNTYMWASKYAIVLMDSVKRDEESPETLNYNVLLEVGGMLMTGRRCAILRDKSVPEMPSDLVGHIYKPADLSDHDASIAEIHRWIRDDLDLGGCSACPE
jgi:hypothetical protein